MKGYTPEEFMQAHQYLHYVRCAPVLSDYEYDKFCRLFELQGGGGSDLTSKMSHAAGCNDRTHSMETTTLNDTHPRQTAALDSGALLAVLSLGAGVQSSTLALMAEQGVIPKPTCAIFADTGHEPRTSRTWDPQAGKWIEGGIYGWLDWLEARLSFPVYRVKKGDLFVDAARVAQSKKSGKLYMKGLVPAFVDGGPNGIGLLGRLCTADYKIVPIQRKVKELLGVKRGPKTVICKMWIGISMDEVIRMKPSRVPYIENVWPLIDLRMTRQDCLRWLSENGYPIAPRSACVGCPFHGDDEWRNLKENAPLDFVAAVEDERRLQDAARRQNALKGIPYLHGSCEPLDTIDFQDRASHGQMDLFGNECEGLCGV